MIFGNKHHDKVTTNPEPPVTDPNMNNMASATERLNINEHAQSGSANNLAGLRQQVLDNAEAVYARAASNLRVVTEVIPTKSGHTAQFCAMIVVQDKVSVAQDHIVTVKLKSKPAPDRLMALQDLLAETELGVHKLLGGLEVGKPARFEYDPPA